MSTDFAHLVTQLPIADLVDHPRQHEFFDSPTNAEIEELAISLRRDGQRAPIDVAVDRTTILCGHTRIQAATLLGWLEIEARIHSFEADSPEAIELLLRDNLLQRQLDPLALARVYRGLIAIEYEREPRGRPSTKVGEERRQLRDILGERFGYSGRQLDRFARLTKLPYSIQRKISKQQLTVQDAERLFSLDSRRLSEAAKAFETAYDKRSCKAIIARYCPKKPPSTSLFADQAAKRLAKTLERYLPDMRRHAAKISFDREQKKILREAARLFKKMLNKS